MINKPKPVCGFRVSYIITIINCGLIRHNIWRGFIIQHSIGAGLIVWSRWLSWAASFILSNSSRRYFSLFRKKMYAFINCFAASAFAVAGWWILISACCRISSWKIWYLLLLLHLFAFTTAWKISSACSRNSSSTNYVYIVYLVFSFNPSFCDFASRIAR